MHLIIDYIEYIIYDLILRLVCVIQDTSDALFTPTKHDIISLSSGSEFGTPQKPDMKRTRLSFGRYILCVGCSRIRWCRIYMYQLQQFSKASSCAWCNNGVIWQWTWISPKTFDDSHHHLPLNVSWALRAGIFKCVKSDPITSLTGLLCVHIILCSVVKVNMLVALFLACLYLTESYRIYLNNSRGYY